MAIIKSKYNNSIAYLEIVKDDNKLDLIISDIKSDIGDVHIEVLQFIYNTDYYTLLEKKLINERKKLEITNNSKYRLLLNKNIKKIEKEIKKYKIDLLKTSSSLLKTQETEKIQKIKTLFFNGKISKALDEINLNELEETSKHLIESIKTEQNITQVYKKLVDNAFEYFTKGQLTILDLKIKSANDRFKKSIEFFNNGLLSIKKSKHLNEEAVYKFKYGTFLQERNQNNNALSFFKSSLNIYKKLAKSNPNKYLIHVLETLNSLANTQSFSNEFINAEKSYLESFKILNKIENLCPEKKYYSMHAMMQTSLADLHSKKNETEKAEKLYYKSLNIFRKLSKEEPLKYSQNLSRTLVFLGILKRNNGNLDTAEELYLEALEIQKQLIKVNRQVYLPKKVNTLNNLAILWHDTKKFDESENAFLKNVDYFLELSENNPTIYLPKLAQAYNNLALVYRSKQALKNAEEMFIKAIKIFKELILTNSETFSPFLAAAQINLARFYQIQIINKEKSINLIDEAMRILIPLRTIPYIQNYINEACKILNKWDVNFKEYLLKYI